jgi:hypothetical protein
MHTMIVSLPEAMKAFVDEQIAARAAMEPAVNMCAT